MMNLVITLKRVGSLALLLGVSTVSSLADSSPVGTGSGGITGAQRQAQQEEIIRRQEQLFIAQQALKDGEKLEREGNLKEARLKYAFAVANLGHSNATAQLGNRAKASLVRVNFKLYEVAKEEGSTNDAYVVLKEILMVDPGNKKAQEMLDLLEENIKDGPISAVLGNPAVNPNFVKKVKEVESNLKVAAQYENTGQFEEAEKKLNRNISLDPYNETAAKEIRKITKKKQFIANESMKANREDRLEDVERKWARIPSPVNVLDLSQNNQISLVRLPSFETKKKLENIIVPDIVFNNASIEDASAFFAAKSREFDPSGQGLSFVVRPEAAASARRFDMRLRNVPLQEALRYATQKAGVKFKVEEFAVVIVPITESTDVLLDRTYNVPPNFFTAGGGNEEEATDDIFRRTAVNPVITSGGSRGAVDAKAQLQARGIVFPDGGTAVYYPESGILQVRNTQDQLEIIEAIALAQTEATYMVDVEVKLVEISQNDINELTFNYALDTPNFPYANTLFDYVPTNAMGVPNGKVAAESALRGSQGFDVSSLDALLGANSAPIPNVFNISGTVTNQVFNMVITSLSQKKSFDLLSSPSVRVVNAGEATINVTRTFFYPVEFDPPETVQQLASTGVTVSDDDNGPPTVIPAFPTEFETRDLGVKLTVKPQIGADNKTIDLALFPEVTEFDGFINYGTQIFISSASGSTILNENVINQPVFSTRRVNTRVFVEDGYTVVLGGLIRDDVQIIDDKVPFLGDLPLLGRLFQSKAEETRKTNLLIFATCKIYLNNGELLNPPELPPAILPGSSERMLQLEGLTPTTTSAAATN